MALQVVNVDELKQHKEKINNYKNAYDSKLRELLDLIRSISIYWQGVESDNFRNELYSIIRSNFNIVSVEMNAEVEYLNKLILVLENAQEQIKNKLNG